MTASAEKPEHREPEAPAAHAAIRGMSLWPPPRSTRHSAKRRRAVVVSAVVAVVLLVGAGAVAWAMRPVPDPSAPADGVPAAFAGSWQGEMDQVDDKGEHVADWDAAVSLKEGAHLGTAEWQTFDCRGSLTLTARTADELSFDYVETYDPDHRCVDEAKLTIVPGGSADELMAEWVARSHDDTLMTSTGALD